MADGNWVGLESAPGTCTSIHHMLINVLGKLKIVFRRTFYFVLNLILGLVSSIGRVVEHPALRMRYIKGSYLRVYLFMQ